MSDRHKCPHCGNRVNGHPNKKFCSQKCKDRFYNKMNPRGYGARSDWDRYADTVHPFSSEAFEQ